MDRNIINKPLAEGGNQGFLIVNVRTARGAFPVAGAIVTISDTDRAGGNTGVIASLTTDESGATEKIGLAAPDSRLSLTPGNEAPYSVYNISTSAEGFYNVQNINVPIFSGVTSIQPVEMIPLLEYGSNEYPDDTRRFVESENSGLI